MSQRIRYSLGLMTICILGIILTQGYWLYKDYSYYRGQPLFSTNYNFYLKTPIPLHATPVTTVTSSAKRGISSVRAVPVSGTPVPTLIAVSKGQFTVSSKKLIVRPDVTPGQKPHLTATSILSPLNATVLENPALYQTIPYEAPLSYVLQKMKWQFGGSILLVLFTSLCFIYMQVTIFMQRKLSFVKNDFINNMTHELKTPLATVSVAIEAMRNYGVLDDKNKANHYLDISKKELDHLSKMTEMIMQFSVYETYKMELFKKSVQVQTLIEEIVERYTLADKKLMIMLNHLPPLIPELYIDDTHISNALRNLIDNSIKYSKKPIQITITSTFQKGSWIISVIDNGPGIPKKYQRDVFERFFRIPNEGKQVIKGFGLGLYYVKQVVELHSGQITLQSTEGQGSTFTISIPLNTQM